MGFEFRGFCDREEREGGHSVASLFDGSVKALLCVMKPLERMPERRLGVIQRFLMRFSGEGQIMKLLKQRVWILREEVMSRPPVDKCPNPFVLVPHECNYMEL